MSSHPHLIADATAAILASAPTWFDEGLAELWSMTTVHGSTVEVGGAMASHLGLLDSRQRWIPVRELLLTTRITDIRDKRHFEMFYAESWAIVHHLMLGGPSPSLQLSVPEIDDPDEMNLAAYPVAKHDHYLAAFGGITTLEIQTDGRVQVRALNVSTETMERLKAGTLLYYTGITRTSRDILAEQKKSTEVGDRSLNGRQPAPRSRDRLPDQRSTRARRRPLERLRVKIFAD